MKNFGKLLLGAFLLSGAAFANTNLQDGTATFSGSGEVLADAEFVELHVKVVAECYDTAKATVEASDKLANQVLAVLEKYKNPAEKLDRVLATGGYVERYTSYDSTTQKPVCVNKFKKLNDLSLRLSNLTKFAADFAGIQDAVYALSADAVSEVGKPTVAVMIREPQAGITSETEAALTKTALTLAVQEAAAKAEVALKASGVSHYIVTGVSESPVQIYRYSSDKSVSETDPAPVILDKLKVTAIVTLTFGF